MLTLAAGLISLAAAELGVARLHPLGTNITEAHPEFLHAYRPGSRKLFVHHPDNGGNVLVRINASGYRGPPLRVPPGSPRLVVYGDSFVAGEFSTLPFTFASQLESALQEAGGQSVEVINAGVAGYGPDQAFLRMRQDRDTLKPDFILLVLFSGNDHGDLLRNKLLRAEAGFSQPKLSERMRAKLAENKGGWFEFALVRAIAALWELRNPEPLSITDYIERSIEWSEEEYASYLRDDRVEELFLDHYDADLSLFPNGNATALKQKLMDRLLAEVSSWAEATTTRVAVIIIPAAIDVAKDYDLHIDRDRYPQHRGRRLSELIERAAADNDLPSISLYDAFAAHDANSLYFHRGDNHWNDSGQQLAARIVAPALVKLGVLAP